MVTLVIYLFILFVIVFMIILPIYISNRATKKAEEKQIEEERKRIEAENSPKRLARREANLLRNRLNYGEPRTVPHGFHKSDIAVITERIDGVLSSLPEEVARRRDEQERHNAEMEMLLKEQNLRLQKMQALHVLEWASRDDS